MGQSAEEVRRDIERTRAQMGDTIDEIGDRVSPRRIVERRTDRVKSAARDVRDKVMGSAIYGTERVTNAAGQVGSSVGDAGSSAAGMASSAVDTVASAPDAVRRQAAGSPLAAGLIAFGAGALLASVLPKTETEERLAEKVAPALQPVAERAKQVGQDLTTDLKEAATHAAEEVKDQATQATEQVKQQATEAAQQVSQQASAAASEVTDTAANAGSEVADRATTAADEVKGAAQRD